MTSGLPDISVAERLADRIVALRGASLPEALRRECDDLLIDVVGLCVTCAVLTGDVGRHWVTQTRATRR